MELADKVTNELLQRVQKYEEDNGMLMKENDEMRGKLQYAHESEGAIQENE